MIWTACRDAAELARLGCARIEQAARRAIERRGAFKLVLAGGSTPESCYRLLAQRECDWQRWQIYFGDERCLPAADPERNSMMARRALLGRVAIPRRQIHPIPAERGAAAAALEYAKLVKAAFPFDLVLLGLGEDGHTASLFPGDAHPQPAGVVAVYDAPKPPSERVSLNASALSCSRQLLFLISGSGKRDAVERWHSGEPIPAATIRALDSSECLVDRAAWGADQLF